MAATAKQISGIARGDNSQSGFTATNIDSGAASRQRFVGYSAFSTPSAHRETGNSGGHLKFYDGSYSNYLK